MCFEDERHFGLTPNVPNTWQAEKNPILLLFVEGKYLNVIGFMTRKNKFYFAAHETTFNSDKMISFRNSFANQTVKKKDCDFC